MRLKFVDPLNPFSCRDEIILLPIWLRPPLGCYREQKPQGGVRTVHRQPDFKARADYFRPIDTYFRNFTPSKHAVISLNNNRDVTNFRAPPVVGLFVIFFETLSCCLCSVVYLRQMIFQNISLVSCEDSLLNLGQSFNGLMGMRTIIPKILLQSKTTA